MLLIISIIVVLAIITLILSTIRSFVLKPSETPVPNSNSTEAVYPANHRRSKEVYEKRYMKNHLIIKVSLAISVVGGIIIYILNSF